MNIIVILNLIFVAVVCERNCWDLSVSFFKFAILTWSLDPLFSRKRRTGKREKEREREEEKEREISLSL